MIVRVDHRILLQPLDIQAVHRDRAKDVSLAQPQIAVLGLAESGRVRQHGLEHGLQVAGRTRDNAQDLGCRRLLLQRLAKLARASLLGIEQSNVLDRDDRLVGELLQQSFLRLRDGSGLGPADHDDAERIAAAQHRHSQHSPPAHGLGKSLVVVRVGEHVLQPDHRFGEQDSSGDLRRVGPHRVLRPEVAMIVACVSDGGASSTGSSSPMRTPGHRCASLPGPKRPRPSRARPAPPAACP
jgi:hypothetical protein